LSPVLSVKVETLNPPGSAGIEDAPMLVPDEKLRDMNGCPPGVRVRLPPAC